MSKSLAYEIASIRRHPRIGGYVITEFTDMHWECNGLLDMQRNLDEFIALNQDRVVVVCLPQWSGHPGASISVEIHAFDVDGAGASGTLHWHAAGRDGGTGIVVVTGNKGAVLARGRLLCFLFAFYH